MKVFVSWSGGKDCMLALHRVKKEGKHDVSCLLNMCDDESDKSRSHGLPKQLIRQQAYLLQIPVLQPVSGFSNYERVFKETILKLKAEGVEGGVFGDIYLQEHRTWIERVCREMATQPVFPLWDCNTTELIQEFVAEGYLSTLVSVNHQHLSADWLGRIIDNSFIRDILNLGNIDPCAENGEYHSFVYDGPLFKVPVAFTAGTPYFEKDHWFLNIS